MSSVGGDEMENNIKSTWDEIQGKCLSRALDVLNDGYNLDERVDVADQLIGIAIAIEDLSLRWAAQHRPDLLK